MSIRQRPDGSFHAIQVYIDPVTRQEVAFAGEGWTREECCSSLDAAIATGKKAFPGIVHMAATSEVVARREEYLEPQKPPMWVRTTVIQPDGRSSCRVMDYNDRTARRRFRRAGEAAVEAGGKYMVEAAFGAGGAK